MNVDLKNTICVDLTTLMSERLLRVRILGVWKSYQISSPINFSECNHGEGCLELQWQNPESHKLYNTTTWDCKKSSAI